MNFLFKVVTLSTDVAIFLEWDLVREEKRPNPSKMEDGEVFCCR
jgi:hypothetical protein